MATLKLENVSADLMQGLAELARRNRLSLEEQAKRVLEAGTVPAPRFDRAAAAKRIAAMTPKDVEQTDSVILLREDRAR